MQPYGQESTTTPLWTPTYTEDTTAIVGVAPMRVKRVHLRLFDRTDTSVDIPASSYNASTLKRMADEVAHGHMEVMNARGEPVQRQE